MPSSSELKCTVANFEKTHQMTILKSNAGVASKSTRRQMLNAKIHFCILLTHTVFGFSHFLYNHRESFLEGVEEEWRSSLRENTAEYSLHAFAFCFHVRVIRMHLQNYSQAGYLKLVHFKLRKNPLENRQIQFSVSIYTVSCIDFEICLSNCESYS